MEDRSTTFVGYITCISDSLPMEDGDKKKNNNNNNLKRSNFSQDELHQCGLKLRVFTVFKIKNVPLFFHDKNALQTKKVNKILWVAPIIKISLKDSIPST